jgi:hypothetical protein
MFFGPGDITEAIILACDKKYTKRLHWVYLFIPDVVKDES